MNENRDEVQDAAIKDSKEKHPGTFYYVWYDLDEKKYFWDTVPIPCYKQKIVAIILDGVVIKSKSVK